MNARHLILLGVLVSLAARASAELRARFPDGTTFRMGQIKEDPQKLLQRQREACARRIGKARSQLADKQWGQARITLDRCRLLAADQSQADTIMSLYKQVDAEGRRRLKEADEAYRDGRFLAALAAYESISRVFGWLPSGQAAKKAIKRAESDPLAQAAVQEPTAVGLSKLIDGIVRQGRQGRSRPASRPASAPSRVSRIRQLAVDKQAKVVDLLEKIVRNCPLAPTGKLAAAELAQLRADQAFTDALKAYRRTSKAVRALKRARMYDKAGMTEKAVDYYRQVIVDFPDTDQAIAAEARVSVLQHQEQ